MNHFANVESLKAYLTLHGAVYAGIGLVAIFGIVYLIKSLAKKRPGKHYQVVGCSDCGWRGAVSRWAGRCPRCNKPLGDQKLKRKSA